MEVKQKFEYVVFYFSNYSSQGLQRTTERYITITKNI